MLMVVAGVGVAVAEIPSGTKAFFVSGTSTDIVADELLCC